jgi:hypothetical protein
MADMTLEDRLAAWRAAGLIDEGTAARIAAFEAGQARAAAGGTRIAIGEVIAYVGSVVLLVGLGFLYGTEYAALGSAGRLTLIGLVVVGSLAAGDLVRRAGATDPARRARAAGWAVAALGVAAWFAQAFVDGHVLTRPSAYVGGSPDTTGALMAAAAIGFVVAAALLWRAGAGLLAFAAAFLAYTTVTAFDFYLRTVPNPWAGELTWLTSGAALVLISETIARGSERRWAREVLRFAAMLPPIVAALVFSSLDTTLELFAGLLSVACLGAAILRGSAGYALAGGIGLFVVVNEVGFRHFANAVGFPVVLIASGVTLLAVAAGLFRFLPLLTGRRPPA